MLKIRNMTGMSDGELKDAVARRCALFGNIKTLKIYLAPKHALARSFALVDMDSVEEARALAGALGRLTIDNAVIIFLQHEQPSAYEWMKQQNNWPTMELSAADVPVATNEG